MSEVCSRTSRMNGGAGRVILMTLAGCLAAAPVAAEEDVLVEKLQHGEIDWSEKAVFATGSGAPNLSLPNVAAIRLAAERAAKLSAYRNILEAIKGVRIDAKMLAGKQIGDSQIRTQVEGIIRGCKTVDTRYFSDYGVDVVLRCRMDGGLAMVLSSPSAYKALQTAGERKYTGLVIDAVGLKAQPALAMRVFDGGGRLFYEQAMVKPEFLRRHGAAAFFRSVEGAKKATARVGDNPMVVRASALGPLASDVKVGSEDMERVRAENLWFLLEGRVAIATDGP